MRLQLSETEPRLVFAYPGELNTPTGGYGYDRRIIEGLRQNGWQVEPLALGDGFPFPTRAVLEEAERRIASLPSHSLVVIDGLAFAVMDEAAPRLSETQELIALVHHPLCLENGLAVADAERLRETERCALQHVREIIVTSPATAAQVHDLFGITPDKIHVVLPGTEPAAFKEKQQAGRVRLLSVGTISPRKGYDLLFQALAQLQHLDWELGIAGATDCEPKCFAELQALLQTEGLESRVTFYGAVEPGSLAALYDDADIFVLASRYEGYGMAYTEALAHGLPVIGSGAGAVKDTLPEGAAVYCGVEDIDRLKTALERLISDPQARQKLASAAHQAAASLPTWQDAAEAFAAILRSGA